MSMLLKGDLVRMPAYLVFVGVVTMLQPLCAAETLPVPAFPGAEGFGAYSKGGRGGRVYHVTTLADGGQGSLREAVEAEGPRIVVLDVSGTIRLTKTLDIKNPSSRLPDRRRRGTGSAFAMRRWRSAPITRSSAFCGAGWATRGGAAMR